MTPRPPCCAIAMAIANSVTVSIAALTRGTFRRMLRVSRVETSTCAGSTVECCGTSSTSSKVRAVAMPTSETVRVRSSIFVSICVSGCLSMAFLVFLAAAAGTWIVPANLWFVSPHRLHDVVSTRAGRARRTAAECRRRRYRGRCRPTAPSEGRNGLRGRIVHRERRGPPCCGARNRSRLVVGHRSEQEEITDNVLLDPGFHVLKQPETFLLVLHQGIPLAVAAKADALLEVIERVQVILPLGVDNLKHDVALDTAEKLDTNELFLFLVPGLCDRPDRIGHLIRILLTQLQALQLLRVDTEHARHLTNESRDIPFRGIDVLAGEAVDLVLENFLA